MLLVVLPTTWEGREVVTSGRFRWIHTEYLYAKSGSKMASCLLATCAERFWDWGNGDRRSVRGGRGRRRAHKIYSDTDLDFLLVLLYT